ncbi:pentapeptide repeat-containing protein [Nitrosospira sp. Is2]|uniref:pentapeptide repeat-containing protein n=1 Tax=Nitrosospira sp. Is2 TaxID=3080532 RepID=UPI003987E41C
MPFNTLKSVIVIKSGIFSGSDFGGSDFGGSDFGGSDFGGSDFGGSDFGGSDFGGSDFGEVGLEPSSLETDVAPMSVTIRSRKKLTTKNETFFFILLSVFYYSPITDFVNFFNPA